jgi:hypothetical protein
MNAYSVLGAIITFVPMVMILSIVIVRGKKIFDQ